MANGQFNVQVANNWKPEIMAEFKTLAESESWVTKENSYNDGTYTRWVFENPTADFYVVFFCSTSRLNSSGGTTPPSDLCYFVCEEYDSVTREFKKPSIMHMSTTFTAAADNSIGNTAYTIATILSNGFGVGAIHNYIAATLSVPTTYEISVDATFGWIVVSASSNGVTRFITFGEFTSLVRDAATNDPVIIGAWQEGLSIYSSAYSVALGNSAGGFTRSAMNAAKAAHIWGQSAVAWVTGIAWNATDTTSTTYDLYQSNAGPLASPMVLFRQSSIIQPTNASTHGHLRAKIPNALVSADNPAVFDILQVGSDEYVGTKRTNSSGTIFLKRL